MTDTLPTKSASRRERGQSLVELAISLTVMLLLLSGAVSFGMALFSYVSVRDAAGEGALYGSIRPYADTDGTPGFSAGDTLNADDICNRVKNASDRPINMQLFSCTSVSNYTGTDNNINVTATVPGKFCEGTTSGTPHGIKVQVDYNQGIFMPFMGAITGQSIHLRAFVTDTILEPRCP